MQNNPETKAGEVMDLGDERNLAEESSLAVDEVQDVPALPDENVALEDEQVDDAFSSKADDPVAALMSEGNRKKNGLLSRVPFLVKLIALILIIVLALVGLTAVRQGLQNQSDSQDAQSDTWATPVSDDNKALQEFKKNHPGEEICLACEEDITGDGLKDLLVITRDEENAYTTPMIADSENSWHELEHVRAPYENQKMRFLDFDKDGIMNPLISGERNTKIGYAVYRITKDGKFIDVFGEGMEDCC